MDRKHRISTWMKREVIFAGPNTSIMEAAALLVEKRVGTLPIVDEMGFLIGVTSISDIIQIFLPDFVSLLSDISFIKDFGILGSPSPESLEKAQRLSVANVMKEPVSVDDNCSLIRALSVMEKHNLRDLSVVKDGKLVGVASRVDIGRAFLIGWQISPAGKKEAR
ncbi:MAG: CBS domain-containing protein [Chloroflexota bacterium]